MMPYTAAGEAARAYGIISLAALQSGIHDSIAATKKEAEQQVKGLAETLQNELTINPIITAQGLPDLLGPFADEVKRFVDSVKAGKPDILGFYDEISRLKNLNLGDAGIQEMGKKLLDMSKAAFDSTGNLKTQEAELRFLTGTATATDRALLHLNNTMSQTGTAAQLAIGGLKNYEGALHSLKAMIPGLAQDLKLEGINSQLMQGLKAARDMAATDAGPFRADLLKQREDSLRRIADLARQAVTAPKATRGSIGSVSGYQQTVQSVQQEIAALKEEAATFGLSKSAAASYRAEQELLKAATASGIPVTDALKAHIADLAGQLGTATGQLDQMRAAAQRLDDLKGALKGFFSDFAHGLEQGKSLSDVLATSLENLGNKLIDLALNQAFNSLFSGAGSSSLFGSIGALFGAAHGAAFSGGMRAFAAGDIVSRPTLFAYGAGRVGLMGEAGPEAIMPLTAHAGRLAVGAVGNDNRETALPLTRLSSGHLGVEMPRPFASGAVFSTGFGQTAAGPQQPMSCFADRGAGGATIVNLSVQTPDPKAFADDRASLMRGTNRLLTQARRFL